MPGIPLTPHTIRPVRPDDAPDMAGLLNRIIEIGGTTAHRQPFDHAGILDAFVTNPLLISCFVAVVGGRVAGFQSLEWSDPDWPGEDRLPEDWAIISTFVDPSLHGKGLGRSLFARTEQEARFASARFIDATIRVENLGGQAFYKSIGFRDYRRTDQTIAKRFDPTGNPIG